MKPSREEKKKDILAGSDDESDGGGEEDLSKIQINEEYARRFEHNKRREALQRLEERKKQGLVPGSDGEDSDGESSSSDDGDDDAAAIASRRLDRRVFEVIRRIRSGDAAILDKQAKMYSSSSESEAEVEGEKPKKKERPLYLKDVNARHLLEEGPEFAAQASHGSRSSSKYDKIVYDEQQRKGLEAFLEAEKVALGNGDGGGEDDDLFQTKPKGGDDGDKEDEEEKKKAAQILDEIFGNDDELDEDDKFLKTFFLNRPYLQSGNNNKLSPADIDNVSEDEEDLIVQEEYESQYNFRHEEAAASGAMVMDRVMGHSRFVEGSVRKKESSRKQQRKSKEERIARAKQEQAEELKHLKNLKKKEIAEKLERIRMIAGIDSDGACKLGADDLEEDFDPEEYDKKMKATFNDSYYEADDVDPGFGSGEEDDLEKPDFDKEDELLGLPKDWVVDVLEEGSAAVAAEGASQKKKGGKDITNGKAISQKMKGKISLKDKVELEKEMEEYYKLDYEDTIGDLKTRFKYKQVKPNTFGLSTYEILASDDKDLNQYVSMKKIAPYREKEWKVTHHKKLSKDSILGGQNKESKKAKTKKKSKPEEGPASSEPEKEELPNEQDEQDNADGNTKSTRSERRKRRKKELKMTTERQAAYGKINPKRHKSH
uniref:Kri1-like C-terminal domain-containing protein n=1 Tax=Oryza brachyantha TaxID=4533 RepID=J3M8C5_ORYBR